MTNTRTKYLGQHKIYLTDENKKEGKQTKIIRLQYICI